MSSKSFTKNIVAALMLILLLENKIHSAAFFKGGMDTVSTNYAMNASRNPAIIAAMPKNTIYAGITATGLAFNHADTSMTFFMTGLTDANSSVKSDMPLAGGLLIGLSQKFDSSAYAVMAYPSDFYLYDESSTSAVIAGKILGTDFEQRTETRELIINPALAFAWGTKITPRSSIGFGIKGKQTITKKEENIHKRTTASDVDIDKTADTNAYTGELVLGYYFVRDKTEFGLTLKSGGFTYFENDIEAEKIYSANSYLSREGMSDFLYDEKLTLSLGATMPVSSRLALSLEFSVQPYGSYEKKDLSTGNEDAQPTYITITENSIRMNYESSSLIRGGFDYNYSRHSIFSAGFAATSNSEFGKTGSAMALITMNYFVLTAGFDHMITPGSRLLIGATATYLNSESRIDTPAQNWNVFSDEISFDLIVGLNFAF